MRENVDKMKKKFFETMKAKQGTIILSEEFLPSDSSYLTEGDVSKIRARFFAHKDEFTRGKRKETQDKIGKLLPHKSKFGGNVDTPRSVQII